MLKVESFYLEIGDIRYKTGSNRCLKEKTGFMIWWSAESAQWVSAIKLDLGGSMFNSLAKFS